MAFVFGPDAVTTGAEQGYRNATAEAARFVRRHDFGAPGGTDVVRDADENLCGD